MSSDELRAAVRWTQGHPKLIGLYDVRLSDGREAMANCDPAFDDEEHPFGEIIDAEVVAFRRIPGQAYTRPA